MPVLTDKPPAPEAVMEMSLCKCKTGCATMRYKCLKNGMVCTGKCVCTECQNTTGDEDLEAPEIDDDDDEEELEP